MGDGISQPSNWDGADTCSTGCRSVCATAEAQVAATQMHHAPLIHEAPALSSEKEKSRSRSTEPNTSAHTFHLMGNLERHGSVVR